MSTLDLAELGLRALHAIITDDQLNDLVERAEAALADDGDRS